MAFQKFRSFKLGLISSAAACVMALPAYAQPTAVGGDALGSVLNQFATQANVEILFSPELVNSRTASAEDFAGEPRENLTKILSGTGLTFEEPTPNVFIITTADARASVPAPVAAPMQPVSDAPIATQAKRTAQVQGQDGASNAAIANTPSGNNVDLNALPGVISGQVTDEVSGQPLAGAIVLLEGSGRTAATDIRGFYRFPTAPAGDYNISVNYLGSEFQSMRVNVDPGAAVTQNFSLGNQLNEIVVYGNRSSLQQALNQQRAADNSATVVSSDLLGTFPAETISEALRRVPGVTFSRDAASGEGDRISVRGFNADAINVQLNGIDLQGTGIDRSIDLSGFLTDNIKQVTIQKSLLPSQEATGSGGLVEIETRSGLDYGDKYFSIAMEREQPFASGFGNEFEISGTGAYQFSDDFGVSATVQFRDTSAQNYDITLLQTIPPILPEGFTSLGFVPERFDFPFDNGVDTPLYRGANYFSRQRDETNLTASLNFAYDWSDHTRLRLDLQNIDNNSDFSVSRSTLGASTRSLNLPVPSLNDEVRRRTVIQGLGPALGIDDTQTDLRTSSASFRGETDIDSWEFDYKIGFSQSERKRTGDSLSFTSSIDRNVADIFDADPSQFITSGTSTLLLGGAVDFADNGVPLLSLGQFGTELLNDSSRYEALIASRTDAVDTTDNFVLEFDARKYLSNSPIEYIEVGAKFDDRERSNSDDVLSTTNITSSLSFVRNAGLAFNIDDLGADGFGILDLSDIGVSGSNVPFLTAGTASGFVDTISDFTVDDPNTPENEARYRVTDRSLQNPIDDAGAISPAKITEEIFASYVETKAVLGDFDLVGGVRYQREQRQGRLISAPSIRIAPGFNGLEPRSTFVDAGLVQFSGTESTQETWTPSVIANYRPSDEMVVRGAYFRSTVHPSIDKIARPTLIVLDLREGLESGVIREANPDLEPSTTDNFDLDLSYYFKDNPGLIRFGAFFKKVSNNFAQTIQVAEDGGEAIRQRILTELAPLNDINPALLTLPEGGQYSVQRPINGEGGDIYGFEAEIIRQIDFVPDTWPAFINNFSVLGNITYTKSEFEELESARNDDGDLFTLAIPAPAIGQSDWSGNASLRYEDGPFSGSIIYTYQDASLANIDEFNLNTITPKFETLDLRLSYTLEASGNRPLIVLFAEGDDMLTSAKEADIRSGGRISCGLCTDCFKLIIRLAL